MNRHDEEGKIYETNELNELQLKAIRDEIHNYIVTEGWVDAPDLDKLMFYISKALGAEPESEWISVKDKLPEKNICVWCFCFEDYQQSGFFKETTKDGSENVNLFKSINTRHISVTHWMPLPKPPQEEK